MSRQHLDVLSMLASVPCSQYPLWQHTRNATHRHGILRGNFHTQIFIFGSAFMPWNLWNVLQGKVVKKIKIKIDGERKKVSHKFRTIQPHRLELACVCIHTRTEKMNEKESDWGGITHTLNFTSKSKCCADEENMKQIIISIKKKVKKWENENMRLI